MEKITDLDLAYFLGLCVTRGEIIRERLSVGFRYKTSNISLPPGSESLARKSREYVVDATQLRTNLEKFFQVDIDISTTDIEYNISMPMKEGSFHQKLMVNILGFENFSFKRSVIPNAIKSSENIVKEHFLMGMADACSCPTWGDRDQRKRCRICIDIPFENWILPIQICKLLQEDFNVRVHNILWGHPNLRTAQSPNSKAWAKEHRIRIFAEEFSKIGFRFEFKNDILNSFLTWNKQQNFKTAKYCWVDKKSKRIKEKPHHQFETDSRIHNSARIHANSFRDICKAMGCCQRDRQ